jgi:hypothetical protein
MAGLYFKETSGFDFRGLPNAAVICLYSSHILQTFDQVILRDN